MEPNKNCFVLGILRMGFFHMAAELLGSFLAINVYLWPWVAGSAVVHSTKCAEPNKFDGNIRARNGKLTEMPRKPHFACMAFTQQNMWYICAENKWYSIGSASFPSTFSDICCTHLPRHSNASNGAIVRAHIIILGTHPIPITQYAPSITLIAWESVLFDIEKIKGNKCLITRHQTDPQRSQPTYLPLSLLLVNWTSAYA